MKLRIQALNITTVVSEPLQHFFITQEKILELFKEKDENLNKHTFIETPGLKVFVFVNRKIEIIFEPFRMLVTDKSGREIQKSDLLNYYEDLLNNFIPKEKISAYGFNYDLIVEYEKEVKFTQLIAPSLKEIMKDIKESGIRVKFLENGLVYDFHISPTNLKNTLLYHLNVHFAKSEIPSQEELEKEFFSGFQKLQFLIEKIKVV
jgi:hypothetical protein